MESFFLQGRMVIRVKRYEICLTIAVRGDLRLQAAKGF